MAEVPTEQVDDEFLAQVEQVLQEQLGCKYAKRMHQVKGGHVNLAAKYDTDKGIQFVKYADRANAKSLFMSEYESLLTLEAANIIRAPRPYKVCDVGSRGAMFIMECLHDLHDLEKCWGELGNRMARLHKQNPDLIRKKKDEEQSVHKSDIPAVEKFGFHVPTYYGSKFSTPGGVWSSSWEEYFTRYLLEPQFQLMEENYHDRELRELWSELQLKVEKCFKDVDIQPALLHGDFCSINCGEIDNEPVVYDPCCCYAHTEFDFIQPAYYGNYKNEFFTEYQKLIPRALGHQTRLKLYHVWMHFLMDPYFEDDNMAKVGLKLGKELLEILKAQ